MNKITINQLHNALCDTQSIVLTVHIRPDADAIGSMLGCYEALVAQGKDVTMIVDDEIPTKFGFLNYVDHIHRVEEFPNKVEADMLLVLDASTRERIGGVGALVSAPIFNIDHHISNSEFADYLYLQTNYAATGEIMTHLCHEWGWPITASMAQAFYMAIAADCGFFKYSNTTAHTLAMASLCVEKGARPQVISEAIESVTKDYVTLVKDIMQSICFHIHDTVASIAVNGEQMTALDGNTDGIVEIIRNIDTVDVAILLKEEAPTRTRISLRSKRTDVNAIANRFGGGGHIRAAGCTINASLEEALAMIVEALS